MLEIRYADRDILLDIPSRNIVFDVGPRVVAPASDPLGTLRAAMASPIGAAPLVNLARRAKSAVLILDDNTRTTPTDLIAPLVLDELNRGGIADTHIKAIVASGTHRRMTPQEKAAKYGARVLSRIAVLDHEYKDPSQLVDWGTTRRGTRILVNRHLLEADLRIAIGSIIPHHPVGWSGGAKAVLPGVAGEETVAQMHLLGSRQPALGSLDTPMRQEMDDFADQIGLSFIVNVVLNHEGELVYAVCGHFLAAHRAGVEFSARIYGAPIPELADLVISSTSPVDFDLFQADKGITSAEVATRQGGEIVLLSECREGISPAHPDLADYLGKMTSEEIWERVHHRQVADPLTAAEAIVLHDISQKMRITLVTEGLSELLCRSMGFNHVPPGKMAEFIRERLHEKPNIRIGILRQSAELFPILRMK